MGAPHIRSHFAFLLTGSCDGTRRANLYLVTTSLVLPFRSGRVRSGAVYCRPVRYPRSRTKAT